MLVLTLCVQFGNQHCVSKLLQLLLRLVPFFQTVLNLLTGFFGAGFILASLVYAVVLFSFLVFPRFG